MRAVKYLLGLFVAVLPGSSSTGQVGPNEALRRNLASLDTNQTMNSGGKLQLLYAWKREADSLQAPPDSIYARLLRRIGVYEYYVTKRYTTALAMTQQALRINASGKKGASPGSAATDLFNIAFYLDDLALHKKALVYYDSAILFAGRSPDIDEVMTGSWVNKAYIYFRMGDYEKAAEDAERAKIRALQRRDTAGYLHALDQRAQALCLQGKWALAEADVGVAIGLARPRQEDFLLASALKSQGLIYTGRKDYPKAEAAFTECIATRIRSKDFRQVAGDYNDLGIFYGDSLRNFHKAEACYQLALQYASKEGDSVRMARVSLNQGENYYNEGKLDSAIASHTRATGYLRVSINRDLTANPTTSQLSPMGNKEMIQALFTSKTKLLLHLYRRKRDAKWLAACLQTALLTDSLIREIRHEQIGEQSKLYWRNQTREFFTHALEACWLAQDDRLAFFFMEESRSVLLQDKLSELGAHAYLPAAEAAREERLQIRIVELQQKDGASQELLAAKEEREKYIQTLEQNYPAYYQYKYADGVRTLFSLQEWLATNKQVFLDYFIEDTVCYALCVQPGKTQFSRTVSTHPTVDNQLARFLQLCADENAQNRDWPGFLASANAVYNWLLKPFGLPGGRVIICQDHYLVPFEALSADPRKAEFLVKNYAFSYVYSARYLMSRYEPVAGRGDFLGIAPVTFPAYAGIPTLRLSEEALQTCSAPYRRSRLLLREDANRGNFMRQAGEYSTVTILTHARADALDEEPLLFMNDSVIRLSELPLLRKPATQLIILSGCETNAGKNRNGEGIFSLARGFSAAGIPAVAATQWMADEGAIYSISQKFNENIHAGFNKDEALQRAKLFYILQDPRGTLLPCYWADMILIGNSEPIVFSKALVPGWVLVGATGAGLILFLLFFSLRVKRRRSG